MTPALDKNITLDNSVRVNWSEPEARIGHFQIYSDKDNTIWIANEKLSKDFIKQILCDMIDQATLEDE